ncbi:inositol transporter 1 isoform X2 [Amborella trichopoda]|uniref:inositol transporter 1 isoform X2 n=1 Tax=Amborella trichopoda TaxID=13333 RepID=UPI0009BCAE98|nr:inositol transporter 1 isoform X2 [Amborella trichopoda]|eukprot:XP_020522573.1 inositol transporter 1 isoform X2 [Amborella trichopoda]
MEEPSAHEGDVGCTTESSSFLHGVSHTDLRDEDEGSGDLEALDFPRGAFAVVLTMAAGIGGFLFGYDTGVISGALLYIREDFEAVDKSTFLQETIVSTALVGAALGAAMGDVVFMAGALVMSASPSASLLIWGRFLVGLGIGFASMAAPLYIAETSPSNIRGALVSMNILMVTVGQFISYLINYGFTKVPGTWRWMLGVAGLPALFQAVVFIFLPESPYWLISQGRLDDAIPVLRKIHSPQTCKAELQEICSSTKGTTVTTASVTIFDVLFSKDTRLALIAGVGIQVFQQLTGINTVLYYSPSIMELAGYASHETALKLSLLVALMNALGTIAGMLLIDRSGRRKLAISSLIGATGALLLLSLAFHLTTTDSPSINKLSDFGPALLCPQNHSPKYTSQRMTCMDCLHETCGFCASIQNQMQPGNCLIYNSTAGATCLASSGLWFTQACPSRHGWLALVGLILYIMAFSPGMGPVPWAVNSEIYPAHLRGVCEGIAATANWVANLAVALSFLSLAHILGASGTFFLFACMASIAILFVYLLVPETKGLSLQEVEKMWESVAQNDHGFSGLSLRNFNQVQDNAGGVQMQEF